MRHKRGCSLLFAAVSAAALSVPGCVNTEASGETPRVIINNEYVEISEASGDEETFDAVEVYDDGISPVTLVRKYGTVVYADAGENSLMLKVSGAYINDLGESTAYEDNIIFHMQEGTAILDAGTGLPVSLSDLSAGEFAYAWAGDAMTLSLPPQMNLEALVRGVPEDGIAPAYVYAAGVSLSQDGAVSITGQDGITYTAGEGTEVLPFRTRNIVTLSDINEGSRLFIYYAYGDVTDEASVEEGGVYGDCALDAYKIIIVE